MARRRNDPRIKLSSEEPRGAAPKPIPALAPQPSNDAPGMIASSRALLRFDLNAQAIGQLPILILVRLFALLGLGWLDAGDVGLIAATGGFALLVETVGWWLLSHRASRAHRADPLTIQRGVTLVATLSALGWSIMALVSGIAMLATAGGAALFIAPVAVAAAVFAPVALAALAAFVLPLATFAVLLADPVDSAAMMIVVGAVAISFQRRHAALDRIARRRATAARAATKASLLLAEFEESRRGWFWETDAQGAITYVSPQLAEAIGRDPAALIGTSFTDLVVNGGGGGDEHAPQERTLGFHLSTRIAFSEVAVRAAAEGDERWWSLSGRPALDQFGTFLGFRGSGSDLTEMRRSEAEVKRLARYDALTGLPNRLLMRQTLEGALRDVTGRPKTCGLFLLDLDRFKNVNDTLGHPVGDLLLRQVAERLQREIGERGRVGRLGGDEFNVVLPDMSDSTRLAALADAVIRSLSAPYMIEGAHVSIGASVGIALAPQDGVTADALVRNADLALYAAKADGKGVHRFYEPKMHASAKDRRLLEVDLRRVLADGGLHMVYQPVVSSTTEAIVGFEALVRWNHPTRGAVSPADFIPIAEEIGLIPQIGEWVLREACMEAANWPDPVRVAVNISPIQFANPALPGIVMSALAAAGLPPHRLELEITEGVFLDEGTATDEMFARLKSLGVRFALDDFGTGYSSLGYLKKAPFNKIKIDQSFVRGAAIPGNRNAAIIRAIVALADSLEMETTAEGAETHDELELIRSLGCSHVQGYVFGRPMAAEDARARVGSGERAAATGFIASRRPRLAVLRTATFVRAGRIERGRLRNLSEDGAMVEADLPPMEGDRIELSIADGPKVSGVVRWAQEGRFGIAFDTMLDLERFAAPRAQPRSAAGVGR